MFAVAVLGVMTTPAEAQAAGPICLQVVEFGEIAEFFALPTGGYTSPFASSRFPTRTTFFAPFGQPVRR